MSNPNQPITNQNTDPKLSQAQSYYLGLFNKWSKPDSELRKLDEQLWQSIDFELYKKDILADGWNEILPDFFSQFLEIDDYEIETIPDFVSWFIFTLHIIKRTKEKISLIGFNFNNSLAHIPDLLKKITELYNVKQLEIINCINCPELDNLILRNELEVIKNSNRQLETIGKLIWKKEIPISPSDRPIQTLLLRHLAFFGEFIELTEGKKVQLRITSQPNLILLEIFSYNGATELLIEQKYYEFISDTLSEDEEQSKITFSKKINPIQQRDNKYKIKFYKLALNLEREYHQDTKTSNYNLVELNKILASKFPDQSQLQVNITNHNPVSQITNSDSLNNNSGQIQNGDNNTQTITITNQAEFVDKLLDLSDVLFELKKQELTPKQSHYVDELEQDINKLKKQPNTEESKNFVDKVIKLTTLGGGLLALSDKILPILNQLKDFLPL